MSTCTTLRHPVGLDARGRPLPSSSAMAAWDREVTNIPGNLDINDITKAFEDEAGKILDCTLQKGTAWILSQRAEDAQKAVDTFHHGELNKNRIEVILLDR